MERDGIAGSRKRRTAARRMNRNQRIRVQFEIDLALLIYRARRFEANARTTRIFRRLLARNLFPKRFAEQRGRQQAAGRAEESESFVDRRVDSPVVDDLPEVDVRDLERAVAFQRVEDLAQVIGRVTLAVARALESELADDEIPLGDLRPDRFDFRQRKTQIVLETPLQVFVRGALFIINTVPRRIRVIIHLDLWGDVINHAAVL